MLASALSSIVRPIDLPSMRKMDAQIAAVLDSIPIDFGGGCSYAKARVMAELIRRYNLRTTVDIGVYRGRSLFPQALAHGHCTGGRVYGIDPWSVTDAAEQDNEKIQDKLEAWLSHTDFDALYQNVVDTVHRLGLEEHCTLIRQPSGEAIAYFRQRDIAFDLIHIDGNHDTRVVSADMDAYVPRLKRGGFVVLDDISWDSVRPVYRKLSATMRLLYEQTDGDNDYAVFWKGSSAAGTVIRRVVVRMAARRGLG